MFNEMSKSDYLFFTQGRFKADKVRYNLIEPLLTMEHTAYIWNDSSAVCVIHKETIALWNDEKLKIDSCIFEELINIIKMRKINITKVLGTEEFAQVFLSLYCSGLGKDFKCNKRLSAYYCSKVCYPPIKGEIILCAKDYVSTISAFMERFDVEAFDGARDQKCYKPIVNQLIKEGAVFLWQDKGRIVSMCIVFVYDSNCARINYVYTASNVRRNGYATMLVSTVSDILLKKGLLPVLYADKGNMSSNRVYLKAGFIPSGCINEYIVYENLLI